MTLNNINLDIKTIEVNIGNDIVHVKTYLPIAQKMEIIDALTTEVLNDTIINQPKFDALLNIFIIMQYTDIQIENKEIDYLLKAYDYLEYYGYIDVILATIPEIEIKALMSYVDDTIRDFNKVKVSGAGTMESLVNSLPMLMENLNVLKKELKDSDLEMVRNLYTKMEH